MFRGVIRESLDIATGETLGGQRKDKSTTNTCCRNNEIVQLGADPDNISDQMLCFGGSMCRRTSLVDFAVVFAAFSRSPIRGEN